MRPLFRAYECANDLQNGSTCFKKVLCFSVGANLPGTRMLLRPEYAGSSKNFHPAFFCSCITQSSAAYAWKCPHLTFTNDPHSCPFFQSYFYMSHPLVRSIWLPALRPRGLLLRFKIWVFSLVEVCGPNGAARSVPEHRLKFDRKILPDVEFRSQAVYLIGSGVVLTCLARLVHPTFSGLCFSSEGESKLQQ